MIQIRFLSKFSPRAAGWGILFLFGLLLGGVLNAAESLEELQAQGVKVRLNADGQILVLDARQAPAFTGETLETLPALKDLKLNGSQVTDGTLSNLASLTALTSLALDFFRLIRTNRS